ncbi:hypothetical protein [Rhizosphaericola mali]|uniref:N-acetyltransferase n=1 Tax=Rhizosphaericola mali TaxID=2545455 RepID=A0A5P2G8J5_9BACT|nr:hypothetical protein [Rhizosphaericola mali]QES87841.1 hypothetical protein E0W69_003880 [Rhizosphaericola mali]
MELVEVRTPQDEKDFIEINVLVNRNNPAYIRPLNKEIIATFQPTQNKHLKNGKVNRWILKKEGNVIGRIAAFIDPIYKNFGTDFPTGGCGYFDCIDDQLAANQLFDTAKKWLQSNGMDAMDGPINIGDRDKNWGLLVEGFETEPYYGMSYNPPYYQRLFENYGFQNYYNQYYFYLSVSHQLPEKIKLRHDRLAAKPEYSAQHLTLDKLDKFAQDFTAIYNVAWAQHKENKSITKEQVLHLFKEMKAIIDPKLVWFAYYNEQPIAMWINIPDVNQYFKKLNGKFGLWQKLKVLYLKKTKQCKRFTGIVFGVIPKFQILGVDAFLIYEGAKVIQQDSQYEDYEMGWTSEWNPRMLNLYQHLGSKRSRHMITYRYIFDQKYPFESHPEITYKK